MSAFATLPADERQVLLEEAATRIGVLPLIVEKDFWVCWTLARIYEAGELAPHVVFKGGTSLSKVFSAIERFSEDVDLSVAPTLLGFDERDLDEATSKSNRAKLVASLDEACVAHARATFHPVLEAMMRAVLGAPQESPSWLRFEIDAAAGTPNLLFTYPGALGRAGGYILPTVKLEIGSLTSQRPTGAHEIQPMLEGEVPGSCDDARACVLALGLERTFWEKATILHAEHHRPAGQPMRDRFARHYADFAALWHHPRRPELATRLDLLADVARHKGRFFASSWARYEDARPGTLRLAPPPERVAELRRDYDRMRPMYLSEPPAFGAILATLEAAERDLNR